ncbi:MAG TPA: hypothetical protein VML75_01250 [Kofleriaceae bacterium]|nr:hypothetical protein [Kofleriaceae bacterium]
MKSVVLAFLVLIVACSSKRSKQEPPPEPASRAVPADAALAPTLGDDPTPERIVEAISTYDPRVLHQLQAAMGACKLAAADPDPRYRDPVRAAVTASLPPMDPGHGVRAACADAMGALGGEQAAETLLVIIADVDEPQPVTAGAMSGLARLGDERAAAPIIAAMLRNARLLDVGRLALAPLRRAAIPVLIAALRGEGSGQAAPGTIAFAAARALGDLRATEAVPALVASLRVPPQAAMVSRKGDGGPTHHVAVIEALRKIGGAAAVKALAAYWKSTDEPSLRTQALDVYGLIAGNADTRELARILGDTKTEANVRIGAGLAYARMARSKADLAALGKLSAGFRADDQARRLYLVSAGLIARAWVGAQCKGAVACNREIVQRDPAALAASIAAEVPGGDQLEPGQRAELANAARERALIDLRLARDAAALGDILAMVASDNRLVHQAALDAMLAVTEPPCEACVAALDAVLAAPAGSNPVREQVLFDTEVARALASRQD